MRKGFGKNYAPGKAHGNGRQNSVGWTGVTPIAGLFEYVFGLLPDVRHNALVWDVRLADEFGVEQYPFGGEA
ncbi:MAG: hypothetical protein WB762_26575 [Candidatus Sulfotelmatobacter sp.]